MLTDDYYLYLLRHSSQFPTAMRNDAKAIDDMFKLYDRTSQHRVRRATVDAREKLLAKMELGLTSLADELPDRLGALLAIKNQKYLDRTIRSLRMVESKLFHMEMDTICTSEGIVMDMAAISCAQVPKSIALTSSAYETLTALWEHKKISNAVFSEWHDLVFAGFTPDALITAEASDAGYWRKHFSLEARGVPQMPTYYFNKGLCYSIVMKPDGYFSTDTLLGKELTYAKDHPLEHHVVALLQGKISARQLYDELNPWRGQHSRLLRDRQRVGLKQSCEMLAMLDIATDRIRKVGAWLAMCIARSPENFVAWVVLLCTSSEYEMVVEWMVDNNWHTLSMKEFSKIAKLFHATIRRTRLVPPPLRGVNPDALLYLNLTNGRYAAAADPDLESLGLRSELERPLNKSAYFTPGHKIQMYDAIDKGIEESMRRFADCLPTGIDLESKMRQEFYHLGATGSVDKQIKQDQLRHIDMREYAKDALTKTIAMNELSRKQMERILTTSSPISASLVWKMESDKQRMMLPGSFDHWMQENILLGLGESSYFAKDDTICLQQSSIQEASDIIRRFVEIVCNECIEDADYTDFNIAHLRRTMQNLWLAIARVLPPNMMVIEDKLSVPDLCRLLAQRLEKMLVRLNSIKPTDAQLKEFPQLKESIVECQFGLFTGWRSTMFINTSLNKIYFDAAAASTMGITHIKSVKRVGDDAHAVVNSVYGGLRQLCALNDADLELNGSKQFVGYGKSELVRVTSTLEGVHASQVRAVCGLISSDLQAPACGRGIEAPRAVYDSVSNVMRRQVVKDRSVRWWVPILNEWSKIYTRRNILDDQSVVTHLPRWMIHSSVSQGGLGLWLPGDPWYKIDTNISLPVETDVIKFTDARKARCAKEAGEYLSRQLVGVSSHEVAQLVDDSIVGNFSKHEELDWRKRHRTHMYGKWLQQWSVVGKKTITPPLTEKLVEDARVLAGVRNTMQEIERYGIDGHRIESHDPVAAVQDLLAAGVKGVVNIIPRLIKGLAVYKSASTKCSLLISMVKQDKQNSLRRVLNEVGPGRFWALLNGTMQHDSDFVWHATPQLCGFRALLAKHLAHAFNCSVVDVMAFDYAPQLRAGWSMLCHMLRDGRIQMRY